ncbi:MAG: hypothetical protein WB660_05710 [Candidatus Sulfotelmatobacter sp.]
MYSGLESLKVELQTAAANKTLSQDRRQLALTLLEFIDEASVPGYIFEKDDYFPDVDPSLLRDVKICVRVNARWYVRPAFLDNKINTPSAPSSIPESIVPNKPHFEEVF